MGSSKIVGEPKIYLENGGEPETPFSYYSWVQKRQIKCPGVRVIFRTSNWLDPLNSTKKKYHHFAVVFSY